MKLSAIVGNPDELPISIRDRLIALAEKLDDLGLSQSGWAPGDIKASYQTADHGDWLLITQGTSRVVNIADWPALAPILGTMHGGDGVTTIGLPNASEVALVGVGTRTSGRYQSKAVTMTIASPCVVTFTGHDYETGDQISFSTTGALPTGLVVSKNYFVIRIDGDTFALASTLANAHANTRINTSGSQSGVHSIQLNGDVFSRGQFKDFQVQGHQFTYSDRINAGGAEGNVNGSNSGGSDITRTTTEMVADSLNGTPKIGKVTRGKALGVNYFIRGA